MPSDANFLQGIDLIALGRQVLAFAERTDPCFVALVLGLLILIGSKMASPYPALMSWGLRLGVAVFLVYIGYIYASQGGIERDDFPRQGLRGLIAAGLVVAPMWIVLPIFAFVFVRLRLALAVFLIYGGYLFLSQESFDVEALPGISLRAGLASALALVVAWILQPVTDFIGAHLLPRRTDAPAPANAWGPGPEATPAAQAALPEADGQRRRMRARLKAELLYTLHSPEIGERFTRKMFTDFINRYLGDDQMPEDVEEHCRELEAILLQHRIPAGTLVSNPNLAGLTRWFLAEQRRIQEQGSEDGERKVQMAALGQRYQVLAERVLEG